MLTKFDSGEAMIEFPSLFMDKIIKKIEKSFYTKCKTKNFDKYYTNLSCKLKDFNSLPEITFVIDNIDFSLSGKEYINSCTNPTPSDAFYNCEFLIQFSDNFVDGYYITLGQTFMRRFYTSFY